MSKHELHTRGLVFKWDDDDKVWDDERKLLDIYERIGNLHKLTTYFGKDPYGKWNAMVRDAQSSIIDWIIEIKKQS